MSENEINNRRQVMQAATIVAVAYALSRFMGLGREIVLSYYFGASTLEVIAYTYANKIPDFIFNVTVGGALASAFIPTFTAYFVRDDERGAWRLFGAIINLVLIITVVLSGLAAVFAPQIVASFITASDLEKYPGLFTLTITMMRIMLLTPIIFGVSGVFMAALNARQHFLAPALAASMYNLGIILGMIVFAPNPMGLAWGTVLGAAGHLVVQLPALRGRQARYTAVLSLQDAGVRQVLRLMGPRVLGLSFSYLNPIVTAYLARPLIAASIVALERAFRITLMPYSILGQAIGVAAFPTLSTLAAAEKWGEMRRIIAASLRSILFLGTPIALVLMILRRPLVQILFERGEFSPQDTEAVSWALLFYGAALLALAAIEVIARSFYAMGDTKTPVIAGMLQLPFMAILGSFFAYVIFPLWGQLPLGGIALGYTISNVVEVVVLLWLLRKRIGGLNGYELLDASWRIGTAAFFMAVVMLALLWLLGETAALLQLTVAAALGGLVYGLACYLLKIEELERILAFALSKFRRN